MPDKEDDAPKQVVIDEKAFAEWWDYGFAQLVAYLKPYMGFAEYLERRDTEQEEKKQ